MNASTTLSSAHTSMIVVSYDEGKDIFKVHFANGNDYHKDAVIPAFMMPSLTGECGSPEEYLGRSFRFAVNSRDFT